MQKLMKAYSIFYVHHYSKKLFLTDRIISCKINTISGWGTETFYIDTKNTNLGLSTINLVDDENCKIQHDRNCKFNIIYWNQA